MSEPLQVADMRSYLAAAGWRRRPEEWRGATLWDHPDGFGALVPPRDGMDDAEERTWELLRLLSKAEGRSAQEIADDIASPTMDAQTVRVVPLDLPSGFVALGDGIRTLTSVRNLFALAARSELEGGRFAYRGKHPPPVNRLLAEIQLGQTKTGSYVYEVRVPADGGAPAPQQQNAPLARRSTERLYRAVAAASAATVVSDRTPALAAFDELAPVGVSANLCAALSELAGADRRQPFEFGFRWARSRPSDLPAETIEFGAGAGAVLRAAANRLWQLQSSGDVQITGLVESLHDDPRADDRWRIRVRGELVSAGGAIREMRTSWLRLTEEAYVRAADAHLGRTLIQARGTLTATGRRTEIVVRADGLVVLGGSSPGI